MGINWHDYIVEAKRCLVTNGTLIIVETTKSLDERLSDLRATLKENLFEIYQEEIRDRFTFIEATKRDLNLIQR
jgi:hypothetical protein